MSSVEPETVKCSDCGRELTIDLVCPGCWKRHSLPWWGLALLFTGPVLLVSAIIANMRYNVLPPALTLLTAAIYIILLLRRSPTLLLAILSIGLIFSLVFLRLHSTELPLRPKWSDMEFYDVLTLVLFCVCCCLVAVDFGVRFVSSAKNAGLSHLVTAVLVLFSFVTFGLYFSVDHANILPPRIEAMLRQQIRIREAAAIAVGLAIIIGAGVNMRDVVGKKHDAGATTLLDALIAVRGAAVYLVMLAVEYMRSLVEYVWTVLAVIIGSVYRCAFHAVLPMAVLGFTGVYIDRFTGVLQRYNAGGVFQWQSAAASGAIVCAGVAIFAWRTVHKPLLFMLPSLIIAHGLVAGTLFFVTLVCSWALTLVGLFVPISNSVAGPFRFWSTAALAASFVLAAVIMNPLKTKPSEPAA